MGRSRVRRTDDGQLHPLARVSRQLERFPIAAPRAGDDRTQLTLAFDVGGETALWQIRTPSELPGPLGNDLYLAACQAWNAQLMAKQDLLREENREVTLTYPELLELIGRDRGGAQYDAIRSTLVFLKEILVTAQNTWREDGRYIHEEVNFSLFDECGSRLRDDTGELEVFFRFSQRLAKALVSDYRLLDMQMHNAIGGDVARRLFRIIDAERFVTDRTGAREMLMSLDQVRARLGLRAKKPALVKRVLEPAHAELVGIGFLTPLAEGERYQEVPTFGQRYPLVQVQYVIASDYWESHRNDHRAQRAGAIAPTPAADTGALTRLLGISAQPTGPVSDLAFWVREIERATGDTRSSGFYKQVVEAFAHGGQLDALEFVLRGVQQDGRGMPAKALGSAFTARIKARAREVGITLPNEGKGPKRSAGMTALGDLLAPTRRD